MLLATCFKLVSCNAELGCRLVVVLGGKVQIDNYLNMRGLEPKMIGGYRITDDDAMLAAMEAAGTSRMLVEAHLSKVQPPSSACLSSLLLCFCIVPGEIYIHAHVYLLLSVSHAHCSSRCLHFVGTSSVCHTAAHTQLQQL